MSHDEPAGELAPDFDAFDFPYYTSSCRFLQEALTSSSGPSLGNNVTNFYSSNICDSPYLFVTCPKLDLDAVRMSSPTYSFTKRNRQPIIRSSQGTYTTSSTDQPHSTQPLVVYPPMQHDIRRVQFPVEFISSCGRSGSKKPKRYICYTCNAFFVSKANATRHSDKGNLAYGCHLCNNSFSRRDYRDLHERKCQGPDQTQS